MGENRPVEDEHQRRAEASAFEPPSLTAMGTVKEFTQGVKVSGVQDATFPGSFA